MNSVHLATPLPLIPPGHSTIRNSEGLFDLIPEPALAYRRRLNLQSSRRILENLGSESILYNHLLFEEQNGSSNFPEEMTDYFKPLGFTQIAGEPRAIPDKAIEKLPSFQGNSAITATAHLQAISKYFFSRVKDIAQ